MVVDAGERLHDGVRRRELAALREREQVEQFLQRQTKVLLTCPGESGRKRYESSRPSPPR